MPTRQLRIERTIERPAVARFHARVRDVSRHGYVTFPTDTDALYDELVELPFVNHVSVCRFDDLEVVIVITLHDPDDLKLAGTTVLNLMTEMSGVLHASGSLILHDQMPSAA